MCVCARALASIYVYGGMSEREGGSGRERERAGGASVFPLEHMPT